MRRLLYFADPMCSWCWGFAPEIARLRERLADTLTVVPVLGGLRVHTTQALDAAARAELAHHWASVQKLTGQPFVSVDALPEPFVYNTRRPSEAVVAVRRLWPERALDALAAIQAAFYAHGRDVTADEVLLHTLAEAGLEADRLQTALTDPDTAAETEADFEAAAESGVMAFPTLVHESAQGRRLLSLGYRDYDTLVGDLQRKGLID